MTMTFDEAKLVPRTKIEVGESYTFYCAAQDTTVGDCTRDLVDDRLLRTFTGQEVTVVEARFNQEDERWIPEESERIFLVHYRDEDPNEEAVFEAYEGELNDWFLDTGQFFGPAGIWRSVE